MIRKPFKDLSLPALALGTMRLPIISGQNNQIDKMAVAEMVAYAMENGVNYFDTAWGYHGGQSEPVMGETLSDYDRDSYFLTSKFPGFNLENVKNIRDIFESQLKRCRTDHFDFYLFHSLSESNADWYCDPKYGVLDYLLEQKKAGRIRHLGFSVHASDETAKRFIDACHGELEFCQMQLNYLDWTYQNAEKKVELLRSYGLPVWVMEPLRGGQLASLAPAYAERLAALRPEESIPGWGFRFHQSIPEVTTVLSGMSNMEQLKQNIAIFSENKPLSDTEMKALLGVAQDIIHEDRVPCTGCRYCVEQCPRSLDIPTLIGMYNEYRFATGKFTPPFPLLSIDRDKWPQSCLGCRSCEQVCPQEIKISEVLKRFSDRIIL